MQISSDAERATASRELIGIILIPAETDAVGLLPDVKEL